MISYYCIVNTPGVPVREIAAFKALDDGSAHLEMVRLSERWPGYETIALYDGERPVCVLANPALGFATTALDLQDRAA
ncbi:MAG: hypothetical protein EON48_17335 [Acetobacteraceae bacterium]|nr:MAG: hypothetical protein EON48_17335 [Acetobacteraceae bacterium]